MQPKQPERPNDDLFRHRLDEIINMEHKLVRLAQQMPWEEFHESFGKHYRLRGRPALPTRLMVGLQYLKHIYDLSYSRKAESW